MNMAGCPPFPARPPALASSGAQRTAEFSGKVRLNTASDESLTLGESGFS